MQGCRGSIRLVRRQNRSEARVWATAFIGVSLGKSLGLASLNNIHRLWAIRMVVWYSSCLVPDPGRFRTGEVCVS